MVRIARVLGCSLRTHLQPEGAQTAWFDLLKASQTAGGAFRTGAELGERCRQYEACGRAPAKPTKAKKEKQSETIPLHLETYFFTKINVEAAAPCIKKHGAGNLITKVNCFRHKAEPRKWMVRLELRQDADDRGRPEYTFHVEVIGMFEVASGYPAKKADSLVRANAPAVLYGSARELIASVSGRGPFGPIRLPTVTFVDEIRASKDAKDGYKPYKACGVIFCRGCSIYGVSRKSQTAAQFRMPAN